MSGGTPWTPAPWRAGSERRNCVVADAAAPGIGGSDDVAYYGGHLICESVNDANASLIAAAPEMADLLAEAARAKDGIQSLDWFNRARTLLTKIGATQ